ncbi:hypothetical protein DC31_16455 [Microbacterium sp. CH12i]|uniref:hypothetical protein n=1 Tax=Microbacterium sp. CH12i TaxID=1479651 RepID=UPI0004615621|nr:hypothetical protein [Microbacterium sp. CH12i]KDA05483.1 hypothetical protein DC31_16455 [Microbacterium sp. CH12i]
MLGSGHLVRADPTLGGTEFGDLLHRPHRMGLVQEPLLVGIGEQGAEGRLRARDRRGLLPATQLGEQMGADVVRVDRG